jgi:PAS domain S-box-containing protein
MNTSIPNDFEPDQKFQQLADHINQVLYITDTEPFKVIYINPAYELVWGRSVQSLYQNHASFVDAIYSEDRQRVFELIALQSQGQETETEYRILRPDGETRWIHDRAIPLLNAQGKVYRIVGIAEDVTKFREAESRVREQTASLERVMGFGQILVGEHDLSRIVQWVTDAARELCGAQFGAFFYNIADESGETYTLYTLSGAPREAFEKFPLPGPTMMFGPTFRGEGTTRIDDVRKDPRFGHNAPYFGLPAGHLPVVSYLAVSVVSRSGEILGGLFFGHSEVGVFTEEQARLVEHLAAQAAVAMDNARLFEMVQQERAHARTNEQNYQFLAETIPQIVWVANADGSVSYFNQNWNEYTGQRPEEGHEWGWQAVIHPHDLPHTIERWTHSVATGDIYEIEYRLRRASDGEYRWHLGRGLPFRDDAGQIGKWFGTCTDIHNQKRSQETVQFLADAGAVLSSSLEYQQVLDGLTRLAVPRLCDWCVVDVEEDGKMKRLAAAHQDPQKVQLAFDLFERNPDPVSDNIAVGYVMKTGKSQLIPEVTDEMLVEVSHNAEVLGWLRELGLKSAMFVPLSARGQTIGVMTIVSAETTRHYTNEDLVLAEELGRRAALAVHNARLYHESQQALANANDAMRARDEFLAIVSHELKTPLTPILGWVSILQSEMQKNALGDDNSTQRALNVIERNVRAQSQLINDLLDVSRIVTGKLRLEVRPLELHPVIEAVLETVQTAANAKGIEIRAHLDRRAGKTNGDPDRLQQVMWNLLTNAIKFTPRGGLIEVLLQRRDSSLQIEVSDSGEGIPRSFLPFVFDRFKQADSSPTRPHGGLGLGFPSCATWSRCTAEPSKWKARAKGWDQLSQCKCLCYPSPSRRLTRCQTMVSLTMKWGSFATSTSRPRGSCWLA